MKVIREKKKTSAKKKANVCRRKGEKSDEENKMNKKRRVEIRIEKKQMERVEGWRRRKWGGKRNIDIEKPKNVFTWYFFSFTLMDKFSSALYVTQIYF